MTESPRLAAPAIAYVDSSVTTSFTAAADTWYVIDTASAAVTVTMPTGTDIGHWVIIQNAPANGPQQGGGVTGNNVTISAGTGETMEGSASETLGPPTSTTTAACRPYHPTGSCSADSGFGAGWMHV